MRIAVTVWEMEKIGGIATQAYSCAKVLNGDLFLLSEKKKPRITSYRVHGDKHAFRLECSVLNIKKDLASTLRILEEYDAVIFSTACIHDENSNWKEIYKRLNTKKVVIVSDQYMDKLYPFFKKYVKDIDEIATINPAIQRYLKNQGIEAKYVHHPFHNVPKKMPEGERKFEVIWTSQWNSIKGIHDLISQAGDVEGTIHFFGSGREFYKYTKLPKNCKFYGFKPYETILKIYGLSKISCNFTGKSKKYYGHFDRTTIEPMFYGCLSLVRDTIPAPYSDIPSDIVGTVKENRISEAINYYLKHEEERIEKTRKAFRWAKKTYDPEKVKKEWLELCS